MKRMELVLAACLIVGMGANASSAGREQEWKAQWIRFPDSAEGNASVIHFRKILELPEIPKKFLVHVSADNQFLLLVNGTRVGSGPARSDLGHWKYETFDLGPMLREGKNELAATVWNFGYLSAIAQMSYRTGFLVQGAGPAEQIANTDESWESEKESGITLLDPHKNLPANAYFAAEPGERLDGAAFDWDWSGKPGSTSTGKWTRAVAIGEATAQGARWPLNWQLVEDRLPAMEMKLVATGKVVRSSGVEGANAFPKKPLVIPPHATATVLLDAEHLVTAYPELSVSGGVGTKIDVTYSEALYDRHGEKGNRNEIAGKHILGVRDEFLPDGPARTFTPLSWRTWRYLQLDVKTAEQPLRLEALRTWFTAYPFEERGAFESDDTALRAIWDIGWRTARLDAHDTYMDTPYWERLQYVGDTRLQALISYTVAGDDRLARQAIEAINDSRIAEGITQSRYPSSQPQFIPTFSLLWVGMVHDFWMYRDDANFVRAQLPGARTVLDWFMRHQQTNGLVGRLPWWVFVDWASDFDAGEPPQDAEGSSAVITLQFIEALRDAAEMEEALGDAVRAREYREAAMRAAEGIRKLCWDEQYGLLADTPAQKHFSQHANIMGVWLDITPKERQREVLTKVLSKGDAKFRPEGAVPEMSKATYYFRFYLARAVEHAGMGNEYVRLLGPWREMMNLGLTTWAEQPEPTRSDSHAWSAHPNYDLLTIVAGMRPREAGFRSVRIEPNLGELTHVIARMPHPKGLITAEYTKTAAGLKTKIELPSGVTGVLVWGGKEHALRGGAEEFELKGEF